jgi:glyoxylate/hydroxypyruvate/2-ketogluconate reductase
LTQRRLQWGTREHSSHARIFGAALDVFEGEPQVNPALFGFESVVLTPHIESATRATRLGIANRPVENLMAALEGRRPPDLLNPDVWGKT